MRTAGLLAVVAAATLAVSAIGSGLATGRLGLAPEAAAQPYRDGGSPAERGGPDARREQIKKKIRALRAYTLTEELELDEQTATRLFPVLSRYDDDFDRLLEQRVEIHRRLRRAGARAGSPRAGNHDTSAIDRVIDEAAANQRAFWDLQDRRLVTLRKILTPSQTAKLLLVLPSLERRIENQLRKAIQRRPSSVDPGTAVEDDDDPQPDDFSPPAQRPRRREGPLSPRPPRSSAPGNTPPCDPSLGPCR